MKSTLTLTCILVSLILSAPATAGPFEDLGASVGAIDTTQPASLKKILEARLGNEYYHDSGQITDDQYNQLKSQIADKYEEWLRNQLNALDPNVPTDLKTMYELQTVMDSDFHDELADEQTKQEAHETMGTKFNEWMRERVDELGASSSLSDFFELQNVEACDKYYEYATQSTQDYYETGMGQAFNDWVRAQVDALDPNDRDQLDDFYALQTVQATEKYEHYATPETDEWKHEQMGEKFNEWVRDRVNDLDPPGPNYLEELEELRIMQQTDKYEMFATPETTAIKEEALGRHLTTFIDNLIDSLLGWPIPDLDLFDTILTILDSDFYNELVLLVDRERQHMELFGKLTIENPMEPPVVTGSLPENGAVGVGLMPSIMITFDQIMLAPSVFSAHTITPNVAYNETFYRGEFALRIELLEPLAPDTTYTMVVTPEAISLPGLPIAPFEASFTTKSAPPTPQVVSAEPFEADVNASTALPLMLTFDRPMDPDSLAPALTITPPVQTGIQWMSGNTVARLQQLAPLTHNTPHTLTVATTVRSADRVEMAEPFELNFITGIVSRPSVIGTQPENEDPGFLNKYPVQIIFDRPMDTSSTEAVLQVTPDVLDTVGWREANMVMMLNLDPGIEGGTRIDVVIGADAKSEKGLPMAEDFLFGFTTYLFEPVEYPDGGTDAGTDAGEEDAGEDDAGTDAGGDEFPDAGEDDGGTTTDAGADGGGTAADTSGCGCGPVGAGASSALLLVVPLLAARRRRISQSDL